MYSFGLLPCDVSTVATKSDTQIGIKIDFSCQVVKCCRKLICQVSFAMQLLARTIRLVLLTGEFVSTRVANKSARCESPHLVKRVHTESTPKQITNN